MALPAIAQIEQSGSNRLVSGDRNIFDPVHSASHASGERFGGQDKVT
jgi:hypothetical protein